MPDTGRVDAMDALRGAMMLLVVLFHAALPYMTLPGPEKFKDASTNVGFDVFVFFLVSFNMPLFFLVAGFFAALVCRRSGAVALIRSRFLRIFVPLVIAWIVVAPLTRGAYQFAEAASTGSVAHGFAVLERMHWLRWDKLYHLWFLVVLLALNVIGLLLRSAFLQVGARPRAVFSEAVRRALLMRGRPLIFALLLALEVLPAAFVSDRLVQTIVLVPALTTFFMLGWAIFETGDLDALRMDSGVYLVLGFAMLPVAALLCNAGLRMPDSAGPLLGLSVVGSFSLMSAFMVFGLIGVFARYCRRPNPAIRYLSDASYWVYLVHLPLIVFIGGVFASTPLPAGFKFVVTIAVAAPLLLLSYHLVVRFTVVGVLLNGRGRAAQPVAVPLPG